MLADIYQEFLGKNLLILSNLTIKVVTPLPPFFPRLGKRMLNLMQSSALSKNIWVSGHES